MFRTCLIAASAASLLLLAPLSASAANKIGKVAVVVGKPSASGPGGSRTLSAGSEVFEDDRIVVRSGNAQIQLDDGTRIVVGPASTLVLDQFVKKDERTASKVAIKALRGTYRFITGRSAKSAYKITTAQATIGIRGTGFDVWVQKRTGAVVLRGAVNLKGRGGGTVAIKSGCQMGEATTNSAKPITGRAKALLIKQNLPFILDQSSLSPRFRLNTSTCNINRALDKSAVPEEIRERQEPPSRDPVSPGNNGSPTTPTTP
jgi:hypothetical protein